MKTGDHIPSLDRIEAAFREHPFINRIHVDRLREGRFVVTQMDEHRPTDLRRTSKVNGLSYECRTARGYEQLHAYHLPSDTIKYVFYRLDEKKDAA